MIAQGIALIVLADTFCRMASCFFAVRHSSARFRMPGGKISIGQKLTEDSLLRPRARNARARIHVIAFFAVICQQPPREAPSGPMQRACLAARDHRGGGTPPGAISAVGGGVKKVLRLFRTSPRLFLTPPRYRADGMPVHFPCISGQDAFRAAALL